MKLHHTGEVVGCGIRAKALSVPTLRTLDLTGIDYVRHAPLRLFLLENAGITALVLMQRDDLVKIFMMLSTGNRILPLLESVHVCRPESDWGHGHNVDAFDASLKYLLDRRPQLRVSYDIESFQCSPTVEQERLRLHELRSRLRSAMGEAGSLGGPSRSEAGDGAPNGACSFREWMREFST